MKKYFVISLIVCNLVLQSCQKDEVLRAKPTVKQELIDCRTCEGHWDFTTDTIPK